MGEISMRCLFYHWMHGNKGNGTHTDQILSLVEHLDPDGPASAAARASATPSPFMQMFIGDGFEKLNDKTKSKPDAKTVVMSRLHPWTAAHVRMSRPKASPTRTSQPCCPSS
jgi:hypothetical protein